MLDFNFLLEYSKTGFGIKFGSVWYGFALHRAKTSKNQGNSLVKELHKNDKDVANYDKFYFSNDLNTLFLGSLKIWWTQKRGKSLDTVEPYFRESKLEQKADHYNSYKDRKNRWKD